MPFNKVYIPKNKKIVNKKLISIEKIINFEKNIFDLYNNGKIKY